MNDKNESFEKHLSVLTDGESAIDFLSAQCPEISRQKLKRTMQCGAVWLTSGNKTIRLRRSKKILMLNQKIHIYYNEKILFEETAPAQLVADEGDFSVWDKPCGMYSQGTKWGDHSAICRWVELYGMALNHLPQRPAFLVHRLDRATSGLILVAHSKKIAAQLAALFESRQIEKRYRALVQGEFNAISENQRIQEDIDGRAASTLLLQSSYNKTKNQSSLLLSLETGRKHQIRKHLSALGFPIIGDRLYGSNSDKPINSGMLPNLQLRSCFLGFNYPIDSKYHSYEIDG